MYYGYSSGGSGLSYWAIIIVSLVLGLITQAYIKHQYNRWSQVPVGSGESGADVARRMLNAEGATGVAIGKIAGHLTDNYDPKADRLNLSEENFSGGSVASVAVACHEAGHAVQHAKGFAPVLIRTAMVPVVNVASGTWMLVFMVGMFMGVMGLVYAAIALFAFSVLFQLVTLPVEFDASRRAVKYIKAAGLGADAERGARQVLTAAALTYVAAALVSILQLVYYLGVADRRR